MRSQVIAVVTPCLDRFARLGEREECERQRVRAFRREFMYAFGATIMCKTMRLPVLQIHLAQ